MKVDCEIRIYPPRPMGSINPITVDQYDGYWAQYKFDDIRILIKFHPDGQIELMTRKLEPVLSYTLTPRMRKSLKSLQLKAGQFHLLDGGLMGSRQGDSTPKIIVVWDILVHDSEYLLNSTYSSRYQLLKKVARKPVQFESITGSQVAKVIHDSLWLPKNYTLNFSKRFKKAAKQDLLEGLVLKDPQGLLEWGAKEENNGSWQIRVRKKTERHVY